MTAFTMSVRTYASGDSIRVTCGQRAKVFSIAVCSRSSAAASSVVSRKASR